MATYRVRGNPRAIETLEKIVEVMKHFQSRGIALNTLTPRTTAGGYVDLGTDIDLPAGQAEHLGVEVI